VFVLDNATDSAAYLFIAGDADAAVEVAELTPDVRALSGEPGICYSPALGTRP
jgi:hypothetical protein